MADQLLLVNPRRRRRRKATRKRTRRRRRRNPRPSYVSGSSVVRRNPRRRRRRGRPRVRRRRNPRRGLRFGNIGNIFQDTVMPAVTAAGGAIGLDIVWGMLPIPLTLKTGPVRYVAKGVGALGMGMVAGMFFPTSTAKNFTAGAMTVVMYEALKEAMATWMPQLALSAYDINEGMGYPSAALDVGSEADLSAYFPGEAGMSAYYPGQNNLMGDYEDVDVFI